MKRESIFKKVASRLLKTTLVPLIILMLIASFFVCAYYHSKEKDQVTKQVEEYIANTKALIGRGVSVADCIQRYPYILENVERKFNNAYEVFDFTNTSNIYIDNITEGIDNAEFVIYHTNEYLYESEHFQREEQLDGYDDLIVQFSERGRNLIWNEHIHYDENGEKYIVLYKKFPFFSGNILECKLYLPEETENIEIFENNASVKYPDNLIVYQINDYFAAGARMNYKRLYLNYFVIISLAIFLILILTILISFIAYSVTSKTSCDIIEFIDKLDADEILDSGMNLMVTQTEVKELAIIKKTILNLCDNIKNIESKKKNVEIELVQSKINPHTMYNSLSAIRLKAFETKQQEIINIVDTMAEYYRMVLNRGQNITLLSDEIAVLEKYVAVNELSNYIKYDFKVEIPAEIRNCRIPHLILLPFIENAVNHALPGMTSGGKISVDCKKDGEFLEFIITDNGVGIKPEMLEKLRNLDNYDLGYGIKNVYQRLKLIYGCESMIAFESAYREGTKVTVRFKCFDENGKEIIRR